jgi:hypothetical protein
MMCRRVGESRLGEQVGALGAGPKGGLKGSWTLPLSCINAMEVQGDLDGGIQTCALASGRRRSPKS